MNNIEKFAKLISESKNIVAFTGAGVSTESGIPDFRSAAGIFKIDTGHQYAPETVLSKSFFISEPDIFFEFYKKHLIYKDAKPNDCHTSLAKLEDMGKIKAVVTQNIDNLHYTAGSKSVIELHGNAARNYCMNCGKTYDLNLITNSSTIPKCVDCGGIVRPDVVLYEEMLDEEKLYRAKCFIRDADMLVVIGTSLIVYPAANLIKYFEKDNMVLVNMSETPYDYMADLVIRQKAGEVMRNVMELLNL